ncbi:hypothetical protein DPMN_036995 [Dreissena polymorpha]|uniref:Uncharacterized protein n=1 Tax=Dreissena polymorpha TaxID=45954 RepID=A0A9D4MBT5_DREPO|nr:hypothetical protein DPMN_036995 [Dreissena polymorpha]
MSSTSCASTGSDFRALQAAIVEGKKECWYIEVRVRAPSKWNALRSDLADRSPTDCGDSEEKFWPKTYDDFKEKNDFGLDVLKPRVSQPISLESNFKDTRWVQRETMRASSV